MGKASLATLLLQQIKVGYTRFRFWFRVSDLGFGTEGMIFRGSYIGSTYPLDYSIVAKGKTFDEIMEFLKGRGQYILDGSRVIYYWMSKR